MPRGSLDLSILCPCTLDPSTFSPLLQNRQAYKNGSVIHIFILFKVIVNSFYELEPANADHYRKVLGRKAWHIGLVSLCNKDFEDKAQRGKEVSIDEHECLKWLCKKKPNLVIYICLGSMPNFSDSQLFEIAMGLVASEQQFIWVVRKGKNDKEEEDWLPKGFEKRMVGKGLII